MSLWNWKKEMMEEEPSKGILNTQSIGDKNKISLRGSTKWGWSTRVEKTLVWKRNCPIQRAVSTPVECPEEYGSSPGSRARELHRSKKLCSWVWREPHKLLESSDGKINETGKLSPRPRRIRFTNRIMVPMMYYYFLSSLILVLIFTMWTPYKEHTYSIRYRQLGTERCGTS